MIFFFVHGDSHVIRSILNIQIENLNKQTLVMYNTIIDY